MLNKELIENFWRSRATTGRTRWSEDDFLNFELSFLRQLIRQDSRILDLGSGFGELSRNLCGDEGYLHAVDLIDDYQSAFDSNKRFRFTRGEADKINLREKFDVVLLFGVVTHLNPDQEIATYRQIVRHLEIGGQAIIKNQCSDNSEDIYVEGYSDFLSCEYSARYPSIEKQLHDLQKFFKNVTPITYPSHLKKFATTSHYLFVCEGPLNATSPKE